MKIGLITSNHQRHRWVAAQLASYGELVAVIAESKIEKPQAAGEGPHPDLVRHFAERTEREAFWFKNAPASMESLCPAVHAVSWGQSNDEAAFRFLASKEPDVVFLFGSGIIKDPLLSHFEGRMINMHLGLSPYYRGSATNFWPLVDGLPECVGVTVHHAILKVDGGRILGQARPDVDESDGPHDMGCRSVIAGTQLLCWIVRRGGPIPEGVVQEKGGKLCRRDDFSLEALHKMKKNLAQGMIADYVRDKARRDAAYPIVAFSD